MSARIGFVLALLAAAVACGPAEPRVVEDTADGYRFVAPAGWLVFDDELRSRARSLLSIKVLDLDGADRGFVEGLPGSVVPQLEEWARVSYIVDGPPVRSETTTGGQPALELTYRIRVREIDPPSSLTYWVFRNGRRLYVLRCVFTPGARPVDEPAVRELLASWTFSAAPGWFEIH